MARSIAACALLFATVAVAQQSSVVVQAGGLLTIRSGATLNVGYQEPPAPSLVSPPPPTPPPTPPLAPPSSPPVALPAGLTVRWRVDGTAAGMVATPAGAGPTLALQTNRGTYVTGAVRCPAFSGSLGCADAPYTSSHTGLPLGNSARTLSFWFKASSSTNDATGICGYGATGSRRPYLYSFRNSYKATFETWGPTTSDNDMSIAPTRGSSTFEHFAMTYDGNAPGTVIFFKNGVQSANTISVSGSGLNTPNAGNVVIGAEVDANEGATGDYSDVQIYNVALTQAQIAEIHTIGRNGMP